MRKTIAAFGEVMMRLEVPDYATLSQANQLYYSFSGTGVNIASSLARFGYRGLLVTTLPKNSIGDAAVACLRKLMIDTSYICRDGHYIGKYFLEHGFGPRTSRVTYSNRLESSFNSASTENYPFEEIAKNSDIVHFCGISLAINDRVRQQIKAFASLVKQYGNKILFDCNFRPHLWGNDGNRKAKQHYEELLQLSDFVIMNEKDAIHTLGFRTKQTDIRMQLEELIPQIADHFGISVVAGTHREINTNNQHSIQGYLYKNNQMYFSPPTTFSVLDRIGAGDAFTAGIIHGELQGFNPTKTLDFAITSCMLAHTTKGDTPLATTDDIYKVMESDVQDLER